MPRRQGPGTRSASRAGQGAFFDWALANALLPAPSSEPADYRVDRETVAELEATEASPYGVNAHAPEGEDLVRLLDAAPAEGNSLAGLRAVIAGSAA